MCRLKIQTDWAEPEKTTHAPADCPELLATCANLRISVDEAVVTRAHHRKSRTISESIFISVYPLAEWLAANWWSVSEETEVPGRHGFLDRHALMRGRSGYCFPDLHLITEGDHFRVEWHPYSFQHAPLDFIERGCARLTRQPVLDALRDFIGAVEERLTHAGIRDSWLHREWAAIRDAEADVEQMEFCRAAAWLGRDPFDLSDEEGRAIIRFANRIPTELREDAFRAVECDNLDSMVSWIDGELAASSRNAETRIGDGRQPSMSTVAELKALRQELRAATNGAPWKRGYDFARRCREAVPSLRQTPASFEDLFGGSDPIVVSREAPPTLDALVVLDDAFLCRTAKRRPDSQRFVVARALFDYIHLDRNLSLLTTVRATRQSEGRAFAAELLAPQELLRDRFSSGWATHDQIADVAEELQVSHFVVEHQIRNHDLAAISP